MAWLHDCARLPVLLPLLRYRCTMMVCCTVNNCTLIVLAIFNSYCIAFSPGDNVHATGSLANNSERLRCGLTMRYCPTEVKCDMTVWPNFESMICRGIDECGLACLSSVRMHAYPLLRMYFNPTDTAAAFRLSVYVLVH